MVLSNNIPYVCKLLCKWEVVKCALSTVYMQVQIQLHNRMNIDSMMHHTPVNKALILLYCG